MNLTAGKKNGMLTSGARNTLNLQAAYRARCLGFFVLGKILPGVGGNTIPFGGIPLAVPVDGF